MEQNEKKEDLRQCAAVAAMQGLLSKSDGTSYDDVAKNAVAYADALVDELEKKTNSGEENPEDVMSEDEKEDQAQHDFDMMNN